MKKNLVLVLIPIVLSSCSFGNESKDYSYLNYKYVLKNCGDIHEYSPTFGEVLYRDPGFTNYISLFNKEKSYINFQCYGTSFDTFYCETTFCVCDINGNYVFGNENFKFNSRYSGGQGGTVIIKDSSVASSVGTIYVYTPYWCRWQYEYDVNGDGNKVLLTFEFWKNTYNELPSWS